MDLIPMALSTCPSYWHGNALSEVQASCPTHLKEFGWGTQSTKEPQTHTEGQWEQRSELFSNFHRSGSYIPREEECESVLRSEGHTVVVDRLSLYFYPFGMGGGLLIKDGIFIELRRGLYCTSFQQPPVLPICFLKSLDISCESCSALCSLTSPGPHVEGRAAVISFLCIFCH